MKRGRLAALAGAVVVLAGGITWASADGPPRVHTTQQRIEVVDGPKNDQHVKLDTTFYKPVDGGPAPAVLLAHGFGGSKFDTRDQAEQLARRGYAVLTWSARGFGESTGKITLDSPDYDVKDVRQLIDWLARRPEVKLDRPGDPRVGMTGQSYGGGISLMSAAYDPRIDAIAPQITWYDLADSLFPNGVFKKLWAGIFFTGGSTTSACGRFLPSLCAMYQKVAETGRPTPEAISTLKRSSPSSVRGRIKVPTLLLQGQSDSLFPLDQADGNAKAITGAPVRVVWYQGGHDGGDPETSRTQGMIGDWFDQYLRHGDDPVSKDFTVTRTGGIDTSTQRATIAAASMPRYPGLSGQQERVLPLTGGEQTVQNPAGGFPPSISALPGLGALGSLGGFGGFDVDLGGEPATFETGKLTSPLQLTGAAHVRVKTNGPATVFVKLYDVTPNGTATPARRLVTPLTINGERDVELPGMDYRFDQGHRLRVVVAATDLGYASPAKPAAYRVSVTSGLTVPVDPGLRTPPAALPWWVWGLPLIAVVLAAVILLTGRRSKASPGDSDGPPLEINGLAKRYKNGQLAVDDLAFRVEQGQVCGLLGPNGAGKTTTLRMVMGLIRPDEGEIRIFGTPVRPGAPVLRRLGSFVEGPGFLPHLSGRDNIELYWRATGRPREDAHMDEALAIADLGDALSRPVRTYSQGMRQRLAIAQAMLGLPDLLILDEPTNGLDPPQIAEMREVLTRYAAAGRTVIVSSHLLAEVEQTCTHVVVMHRGTRVAAGPVGEIVGSDGAIVIGTAEVERAAKLLDATPYGPGVLVELNGRTTASVVAALVEGGVPVERVMPHRRLEDAFLALIGESS